MRDVQYPVAMMDDHVVDVSDAVREQSYACIECGDRMVPVLGEVRIRHLRHQSKRCDPDQSLHSYAVRTITEAHSRASREIGGKYAVALQCWACHGHVREVVDLTGWQCESEKSVVPHTRSDIVFTNTEGQRLVVEVVVTHPMEPETKRAYAVAMQQVLTVHPTWGNLHALRSGLGYLDVQAAAVGMRDAGKSFHQIARRLKRPIDRVFFWVTDTEPEAYLYAEEDCPSCARPQFSQLPRRIATEPA